MRILAAYFPAWPLQVAARATPGLRPRAGRGAVAPPFAVADAEVSPADPGSRQVGGGIALLAVSAAARRAGVRPGMTVAQACAVCPALVVRPVDPAAHEVARIAIAEVLSGFGPTVEVDEPWSAAFADVTGDRDEAARPRALEEALKRAGFTARAAIASNRFTARTVAAFGGAAHGGTDDGARGARVIPPGGERAALAGTAVEALALPSLAPSRARTIAADPITAFRKLGLSTLGEVARLPADALARRFGAAAAQLAPLARGEDATPLAPFRLPDALFEKVDLPAPATALEALLFPMRMLVDRVCARLDGRGRTAARLALHLVLEEWGRAAPSTTVELRLPRPSASAKTILEVARERLAPVSLPGPVAEIAVEVVEWVPARRAQLDLFARATPPPERLAVTLGRLASAFGHEAVFAAELVAEHRPERAFRAGAPPQSDGDDGSATATATGTPKSKAKAKRRSPPAPPAAPAQSAVDAPTRPVRLLRVPEPVTLHPGPRGTEVVLRGRRLQVVGMDGPERLSGDWWERAFDRDYFRVHTEEGSQWWVFQDRAAGSWHLHGLFD